jgi:hypothetical protein
MWIRLSDLGVIRMSDALLNFLQSLSPKEQGVLFLILGAIWAAIGLGMLRMGRHVLRGLRFTLRLGVDSGLRLAARLRKQWRANAVQGKSAFSRRSDILTIREEV